MSAPLLEALGTLLAESDDADEALRRAVQLLVREPGVSWAGIAFLEDGELALGPSAGEPRPADRHRFEIAFQGDSVGELQVDGEVEEAVLGQAADLLAAHVLIGWDTQGEAWEP